MSTVRSPGIEKLKTTALVLVALVCLWNAAGRDTIRFFTTPWVRVWNVYHYYIGSKYFQEVGYLHLYDASLLADKEQSDYWHDIKKVRNLETYELESRSKGEARFDPSLVFSSERWREFQGDLAALQVQLEPRDWKNIFRDRGYNPSPFWNAVGAVFSRRLPATNARALKVLCALDLSLFLGAFAMIAAVFGIRNAALVLILLTLSPVNEDRFVGGFLQYDWFCTFAVGVCFLKLHRPAPAAAFLAYAILARIFPGFLIGSAVVPFLWFWFRKRKLIRFHLFFFGYLALFLTIGLSVGSMGPRGIGAWKEFASKIGHHAAEHTFGERRIGLKHIFTRDVGETDLEASMDERREAFRKQQPIYLTVAAILLGMSLFDLRRARVADALLLGLVGLFALTVSSRYYWSYLSLLPLLSSVTTRARRRRIYAIVGQVAVFAGFYAYAIWSNGNYAHYAFLNILLLMYLGSLALIPGRKRKGAPAGAPPELHSRSS